MKSEFDKYIQLYNADLTRLCASLCGNLQDAEDLLQETWLKAMRFYKKYDSSKPFDKWLYSICVNTYKNSMNLAFVKRRKAFANEEEERLFFNCIPEITDDKQMEDYHLLHTAIMSLDKKQKIVIVLYYFKDYTINEIAQIIKIPVGTVKSRLHSAKEQLKRRLTDEQKN